MTKLRNFSFIKLDQSMKHPFASGSYGARAEASCGFNALIGAIDMMEQVSSHHFQDKDSAKTFCIATQNALGVSQTQQNDYVVYTTALGPPFKIPDQTMKCLSIKPKWMYLKAYYSARNVNILCNLAGSTHTIGKKGRVGESFALSKGVAVKLVHHTCVALDQKPCVNCKKRKAHARCIGGCEFYALCSTRK